MAVQTAKAFRTALRKEPLQNFYYLYGADLVQVAELTDQLVQVATNQQPESALTKLDGKKLDLRELEDAAQMFSLFAPYNCILIHDLNAESLREPAFQQLMELLKTISGVTVLIFQITGFDVKDGRRSVSGKNKKLIDWIAKHGTVCEAVPASLSELVRQLSVRQNKPAAPSPNPMRKKSSAAATGTRSCCVPNWRNSVPVQTAEQLPER